MGPQDLAKHLAFEKGHKKLPLVLQGNGGRCGCGRGVAGKISRLPHGGSKASQPGQFPAQCTCISCVHSWPNTSRTILELWMGLVEIFFFHPSCSKPISSPPTERDRTCPRSKSTNNFKADSPHPKPFPSVCPLRLLLLALVGGHQPLTYYFLAFQ
jgi:hypothetical protein